MRIYVKIANSSSRFGIKTINTISSLMRINNTIIRNNEHSTRRITNGIIKRNTEGTNTKIRNNNTTRRISLEGMNARRTERARSFTSKNKRIIKRKKTLTKSNRRVIVEATNNFRFRIRLKNMEGFTNKSSNFREFDLTKNRRNNAPIKTSNTNNLMIIIIADSTRQTRERINIKLIRISIIDSIISIFDIKNGI